MARHWEDARSEAATISYLVEYGGEAAHTAMAGYDEAAVRRAQAATAAQTLDDLRGSSATVERVAEQLGVSLAQVADRVANGGLYAFTLEGEQHLPRWQFQPAPEGRLGEPLPRLSQILSAIPRDMHPLVVESVMIRPDPDLGGESPVDHLCDGGAADPVVALFVSLRRSY